MNSQSATNPQIDAIAQSARYPSGRYAFTIKPPTTTKTIAHACWIHTGASVAR